MSKTSTPLDPEFTPLYDGAPVVVRLVNGEEILTVAYHSTDDDRAMLERPIAVVYETTETKPSIQEDFSVSRVRTRFERWISMSDATLYPVYLEHILTVAPLADKIVQAYLQWAEKLYDQTVVFREMSPVKQTDAQDLVSQLPPDTSAEEVQKSYFDYVLHNFKPKGKPN
jgi:hypothetical protein